MPLYALLFAALGTAQAAEVQFEGFYRARARGFDTLSLTRDATLSPEGGAFYAEHRLWLRPRFVLSDKVALYTEFLGLENVVWGTNPGQFDPFQDTVLPIFEYPLRAPGAGSDGALPLDFQLWRAWAEVHTKFGRFTVGRVPLHWGLGIWLNDGVSVNPLFADYGDTTDRLMWEYLAAERLYVRAALDIAASGVLGAEDDQTTVSAAVAYRSEDITAGVLLQYDRTGPGRPGADALDVFTVDLAGEVTVGKLHAAIEAVGHFGSGDIINSADLVLDDQNIVSLGAAAEVSLDFDPWIGEIKGGFASGDATSANSDRRGYAFDRDYSVGMFLFEQPMPTLAGASARDFSQVRSGTTISNALYVAPTIRRRLFDGMEARLTYLTARTAAGDERSLLNDGAIGTNAGYGHEVQLGVEYRGIDHVELDGRAGLFIPGTFFRNGYNVLTGDAAENSFGATAYGLQITGRVLF